MTTKEKLHRLVDALPQASDQATIRLLEYLHKVGQDPGRQEVLLHLSRLIDLLDNEEAEEAMQTLRSCLGGKEEWATDEELERMRIGEEEIARGQYVTLDQL